MIVKGEEYSARLQSYSTSTIQKMSDMINEAKSLEKCKKILQSVAESETETEFLAKLKNLED